MTFQLGSLNGELTTNHGITLLRLTGFPSKGEAETFFPKIQGALLRLAIVKRMPLRIDEGLQEPMLNDPPIEVRGNPNFGGLMKRIGWTHLDGSVDPTPSVIIPEHLHLLEMGTGSARVRMSMPVSDFVKALEEGLALPTPEAIVDDDRLALAVDLYAASLWESTPVARVVSLATTLEALLEPEKIGPSLAALIDKLLQGLDDGRDRASETDGEGEELDRLRSRLASLKDESISQRLRQLVESEAAALSESPEDAAKKVSEAYGVRSKLLHEGHANEHEVRKVASWLQSAVPRILETQIDRRAGS